MATKVVPSHLYNDRYWRAVIHLFTKHPKLQMVFTQKYFDLDNGTISITALKRKAGPWSQSEKVMLNLALHLFNENNKFNLSDLDCLDSNNMNLAFEAMNMRFRGRM